jgi:hypothetical protein
MPFRKVTPGRLAALRPLYEGFTGAHGIVDSVLEGVLGEARTDNPQRPRFARLSLDDFHLVAGEADAPGARDVFRSLREDDTVVAAPPWWEVVTRVNKGAEPYDRFAFRAPPRWDKRRLAELRAGLPEGFTLSRVTAETVLAFEGLARSLVGNFPSRADFLARGVGFAITDPGGKIVAGCSSYAISSQSLEFEIQTHPDFRRRGLALVTGATMIEHCLENGLEPCWDAAHEGSALLAEQLGFVGRRRYTAYYW